MQLRRQLEHAERPTPVKRGKIAVETWGYFEWLYKMIQLLESPANNF